MLRINLPPVYDPSLLAQAESYAAAGHLDEAGRLYRKVLEHDPSNSDALFGLGTVELQQLNYAKALVLFEQAFLQLDRGQTEVEVLALVKARIGLASYQLCDAEGAIRYWKESLALAANEEVEAWIAEIRPMTKALVSIVIPTFNYARYLTETLHSIFDQSHKNIQLILVNDASTDNTDEVVAELKERYRFEYIKNPSNRERSASLNIGSAKVLGDYIIAFDADDIMLPGAIEAHLSNLDANPEVLFSYGRYDLLFDDGSLREEKTPLINGEMFDYILCGNFILPSATMYRRSAWLKTSGFNEATTFQDSDLWLKLLHQGRAAALDQLVVHYRRHPDNASGPKHARTQYVSRMAVLDHWKDEPTYDMACMYRWIYHDKQLADDIVEGLIGDDYHDPYLDYRYAKLQKQRGNGALALDYARKAKDALPITSYLSAAVHCVYLETLVDAGNIGGALALCRKVFALRAKFKSPDFCWNAAEFLMTQGQRGKVDPKDIAMIEAFYEQALAIGETPRMYVLTPGCGTYLAAMQLGQIHSALKRYEKAMRYFLKATEYGYLAAFGAYTRARRASGRI